MTPRTVKAFLVSHWRIVFNVIFLCAKYSIQLDSMVFSFNTSSSFMLTFLLWNTFLNIPHLALMVTRTFQPRTGISDRKFQTSVHLFQLAVQNIVGMTLSTLHLTGHWYKHALSMNYTSSDLKVWRTIHMLRQASGKALHWTEA